MPSLRARLTNAFLRLGTKRRWRPDLDIHLTRDRVRRMDARLSGRGSSVAVEEIDAGGVPAAWHGERSLSDRGTLLYLHGGAWCLHLPGTYRRLADRLSALTGLRVLLLGLPPGTRAPLSRGGRRLFRSVSVARRPGLRRPAAGDRRRLRGRQPHPGDDDAGAGCLAAAAGVCGIALAVDRPHDVGTLDRIQRARRPDVRECSADLAAGPVLPGGRAFAPVAVAAVWSVAGSAAAALSGRVDGDAARRLGTRT